MKCPFCTHPDTRVLDSRMASDGASIRRRRECESCRRRFTTYERREEYVPVVVKKDGRREDFRRQKVLEGLRRATEKRAVPVKDLEEFVDGLLGRIQDLMAHEVESRWIGEQVMTFLRDRDPVAYVRFASVYRQFHDIEAFQSEIRTLMGGPPRSRGGRKGSAA
jgi:transcriptional repressor NrdR